MTTALVSAEVIAQACHETNRVLQLASGDPAPSAHWNEAEEWQRESAIDGVRKALEGTTPEEQHEAWVRFKTDDGWTYGEVKDPQAKTHPCMVPYGELPAEQKLKDAAFVAIVRALSGGE